jgi:hypothetical protein
MLALDDPVALAAGAAIFRRGLARRTSSAAASAATRPATGAVPQAARSEQPPFPSRAVPPPAVARTA